MSINMAWRWEVRGPGGLVEVELVLQVRMLLDTWSPSTLLIMVCRGAA